MSDLTTYVKRLEDRKAWEVKLGAGINPIIISDYDYQLVRDMPNGTSIPQGGIDLFVKKADAVALIAEWKEKHAGG